VAKDSFCDTGVLKWPVTTTDAPGVAVLGDNDNEMLSSFAAGGATVVVGEFVGPEVPFK
jgi:hypothetical protein